MAEPLRASGLRLLLLIAAVALAYYASGRLGLLLAIPPGYATAVWPASGIALAAAVLGGLRVLPGVALGSFALNIATAFDPALPLRSALVPGVIALGAAAQAGLGALLIGRYVGYSNVLVQELAAVRMLALGGPVACLLNAVVGVGALWLGGKVEADAVWLNLGTWWVGDTIGVLIFAPLVWVWAVRPHREWILRQLFVTVPLAGLFATVVVMFVFISRYEQTRVVNDFEDVTRTLGREVRKDLTSTLDALNALEGFYASSKHIDAREFDTFARRLVAATPAIRGLTWNPLVPAGQRRAFEAEARAAGLATFRIRELDAAGAVVDAGPREFHVPIRYISPAAGNEQALGFDVASDPERRVALELARDGARPIATRRVELVQGGAGVVVYEPVFRGGVVPETVGDRRDALLGYVAVVLRLQDFLRVTVDAALRAGMTARLVDAGPLAESGVSRDPGPELLGQGSLRNVLPVPFAGRELHLWFELPAQTLLARRGWATWAVLTGGLALTSLVGLMLLLGVGREAHTDALVRERTESLRQSEERARHEAMHDHLTGLANRLLFLDRLEQAIEHGRRRSERFGLLYMDIDGFKAVNDSHGHQAGDELLRQIAGRLRTALRAEDTVARLGGDEFAVLLSAPTDADAAMHKGRQLVAALGAPYDLALAGRGALTAQVGASVGVALFPDHGPSADDLVQAADGAMYQAKKGGKNACRFAA